MRILALAAWLLSAPAAAHESDPLTGRTTPLRDADIIANAAATVLVADSVRATNERLRCTASPDRTRRVLAKEIDKRTSRSHLVYGRGLMRSFGHSRYSALLETARIDRLDFPEREDLYGPLPVRRSLILATAGPASTVRLSGVRVSTDKLNHFFAQGYDYAKKSRWGEDKGRALRWGTRTERTFFGWLTSNAFSYADLKANVDGMDFYLTLLDDTGPTALGADGCVVMRAPFRWKEHLDWQYDEALNPPVFTPPVEARLAAILASRRDDVCEAVAEEPELADPWLGMPDYAEGKVPVRRDVFGLGTLCSGGDGTVRHRPRRVRTWTEAPGPEPSSFAG